MGCIHTIGKTRHGPCAGDVGGVRVTESARKINPFAQEWSSLLFQLLWSV